MKNKEERQSIISEYETKQVGLNIEAYNIIDAMKKQLIKKHKKNFTFSDAIIELKNQRKGTNIQFTKEEIIQIKSFLKGGNN